jgi:threonine synthase
VAFTVPTGNFGDVYAGYVASKMGLPIDRLVVATNINDILARTFASGDYEIKDVMATTSPSMDIQISSNFERLLFDAYGRDAKSVRALMGSLAQSRRFSVSAPALKSMRALFTADRASEQESAAEIRAWMREAGYCADPHTAVALAVAEKETRDPSVPMVVLSTAHPAKFPDAVHAACGHTPALPDWLADLPKRPERVTVLPADQAAVERFVSTASRAAREGAAA